MAAVWLPSEDTMSNVLQLFGQKKIEDTSDPETIEIIAITDILASNARLARTVREISKHLDTVEYVFDALSDIDTRNRIKQAAKLTRERLTTAVLELSQQVRKLPALERVLAEAVARRTSQATNQD
jgi:hypothetical protein